MARKTLRKKSWNSKTVQSGINGYNGFMQKLSTPFEVARIEMQKWWNQNKVEGSGGCLHNGHSVFLPGARDTFQNGLKILKHVPDVSPNMYKQIKANVGMLSELADSLGLCGTARYNLKLDWKWTSISE
jgi:hypothetical protein